MKDNESRRARKKAENNRKINDDPSSGISKAYYWAIGILFVILIGLTIFIFAQSGNNINLEDENNQTEETQEQQVGDETNETEDTAGSDDTDSTEATGPEETSEADEDTTDESEEENATVNVDAPLDEDYQVDYADGSADRLAIKNQVIQVTGLDNNLIEWWVGNNGPGQVKTTVSNRDQSEVYRVYLQFGDGSWHVTNYETLPEVPADVR